MNNLEIFKKYFYNIDLEGEYFLERFWIKSNKYYIFILDSVFKEKTYIMFSKKYYLTIELTKSTKLSKYLELFSEIVSEFRVEQGLEIEKYEYWLPHCLVNGKKVDTQYIACSYGVSNELAIEYLTQFDEIFKGLYDVKRREYFGLPLFNTFEEAEKYIFKDNTKKYLQGLKEIEKLKRG